MANSGVANVDLQNSIQSAARANRFANLSENWTNTPVENTAAHVMFGFPSGIIR